MLRRGCSLAGGTRPRQTAALKQKSGCCTVRFLPEIQTPTPGAAMAPYWLAGQNSFCSRKAALRKHIKYNARSLKPSDALRLCSLMLILRGAPALSSFRLQKLLLNLQQQVPAVTGVVAEFVHFVDVSAPLDEAQEAVLKQLLTYGPTPDTAVTHEGELDRKSTRLN